nr:hypothetical protein Ade03nite_29500 [Actinoplanes derwentensis]
MDVLERDAADYGLPVRRRRQHASAREIGSLVSTASRLPPEQVELLIAQARSGDPAAAHAVGVVRTRLPGLIRGGRPGA